MQDEFGEKFDPKNNRKDAEIVAFLVKWLRALGFGDDEIAGGRATHETIQDRAFLAQMKARENDEGYYDMLWRNPKALTVESDEDGTVKTPANSAAGTVSNPVADVEAALKADIENA